MGTLPAHTRADLNDLARQGEHLLELAKSKGFRSQPDLFKSWLQAIARLTHQRLDESDRADLIVAAEPIMAGANGESIITQAGLVQSLAEVLVALDAIRKTYTFKPEEIPDSTYTKFLQTALFEDQQLNYLGQHLELRQVAKTARIDIQTASRCMARLIDEELGYEDHNQRDHLHIDQRRIAFELEQLAQPQNRASMTAQSTRAGSAKTVDFVVITALPEERDAVFRKLSDVRKLEKDGADVHTYYEASIQTQRSDGSAYRVIVTSLTGVGPQTATSKAQAVTQRWNPTCVLLVGIAGGVRSKTELGDVLIASMIADYTLGKVGPQGRKIRWQPHRTDANLYDSAHNLSKGWQGNIQVSRPSSGSSRVRYGVIASGGDVVAYDELIAEYDQAWDKLIGVEMEGGGVATGLHETMQRPRFLMVRGVSDYADQEKGTPEVEQWREYACDVAASYAIALLREGPILGGSTGQGGNPENP